MKLVAETLQQLLARLCYTGNINCCSRVHLQQLLIQTICVVLLVCYLSYSSCKMTDWHIVKPKHYESESLDSIRF